MVEPRGRHCQSFPWGIPGSEFFDEDGVGEGETSCRGPKFLNLLPLFADGLLQLGHGFTETLLGFGGLVRFVADTFVELVLQIDVSFEESHSVDSGLGGEGHDGEAPVGLGGGAGEEAVDRVADAGALVIVERCL